MNSTLICWTAVKKNRYVFVYSMCFQVILCSYIESLSFIVEAHTMLAKTYNKSAVTKTGDPVWNK